MKVLFVSSGNANDGISTIVKSQGASLRKADIIIDYFTIKGRGIRSYIKHIRILKLHLRSNSYNLVHSHYSMSSFIASLAGCYPQVVSLMGSDTKSGFFWKSIIRLFSSLRWQAVIVKSESMKRDIQIKKALIIPNGIDLEKVRPSDQIKQSDIPLMILFAADPSRYVKNFNLAEKAVSLVNHPSLNLKVVHSKSHEDIITEINIADIIILTSRWEGSPNIIKEAMACNRPIVSTDVGDVRWLFGNEPGHFLTSFDPEDVAEKIQLALEFAEKHGRTRGRERILELGLDAETVAGRIVKVYEEVIKCDRVIV